MMKTNVKFDIVLASASPRRRELLEQAGVTFRIHAVDVDEGLSAELAANPLKAVAKVAERKARAAVDELVATGVGDAHESADTPAHADALAPTDELVVIASDTMVVLDGEIFGKPHDEAEARRMLRALSGRAHDVNTAVSVCKVPPSRRAEADAAPAASASAAPAGLTFHTFVETTHVHFRALTDDEISAYIATGDPFDKAGAYGIQSGAGVFVDHIDGDLDTVIGLPVTRLLREFPELQ